MADEDAVGVDRFVLVVAEVGLALARTRRLVGDGGVGVQVCARRRYPLGRRCPAAPLGVPVAVRGSRPGPSSRAGRHMTRYLIRGADLWA